MVAPRRRTVPDPEHLSRIASLRESLSPESSRGLLFGLLGHLTRRDPYLADLTLTEAAAIVRYERFNNVVILGSDGSRLDGDNVARRLDRFALLDLRRGRQRPPGPYEVYSRAVEMVSDSVRYFREFLAGRSRETWPAAWGPFLDDRQEWKRLVGDVWASLRRHWPAEVRPSQPAPPEALVDQVMKARTPTAAGRALVIAASGVRQYIDDPDTFRRALDRHHQKPGHRIVT